MFEDYLEDSYYFAEQAKKLTGEREKKRYYRASVFYAVSAIEAFVNYIGDTFAKAEVFQPYEIAFLTDSRFAMSNGRFEILEQTEYHRLEDKLKFLICKFIPDFDFILNPAWSRLVEFKKFRDAIIHPRQDEDEVEVIEYDRKIRIGLTAIIEIINYLCNGIFGRSLRKKIIDLTL